MKLFKSTIIIAGALLLLSAAYTSKRSPQDRLTVNDAKIDAIISQMTLEEKCALLSGKDVWHTRAVERLGIPAMMLLARKGASDGRASRIVSLPSLITQAAKGNG